MCALYTVHTTRKQIQEALESMDGMFPEVIEGRFTVSQKAPVLISDHGKIRLAEMQFGLIPSWSKERKPKFATHNSRLFSEDGTPIYKKATWRGPFSKHHCLIPISRFIEPIYTGKLAGNMIQFFGDELLFAVGITDSWTDQKSGEKIDSFSIITHDPPEFVKTIGHDRCPHFISGPAAQEWLELKTEPEHMVEFLIDNRFEPKKWHTEIDRALKAGWEKRK